MQFKSGGRLAVLSMIEKSRKSIKIRCEDIDDGPVLEALNSAVARGARVQVIVDRWVPRGERFEVRLRPPSGHKNLEAFGYVRNAPDPFGRRSRSPDRFLGYMEVDDQEGWYGSKSWAKGHWRAPWDLATFGFSRGEVYGLVIEERPPPRKGFDPCWLNAKPAR